MKNFNKNIALCCFLMLYSVGLFAQVSFTNAGDLLDDISGSSYEDCAVDMNGDYLDDVVRVTGSGIYIDYQQPDGTFSQTEFLMNLQNFPDWSICAGDIDGNGYNDLLIGGGQRVSFIYANDDGTAYTEDFIDEYIFSQRSTFADIDNDGNLDAFVCHDIDQSHPYRNDGSGNRSEDQTLIETLPLAGNYAALWVDYDNDWDTDLYITKCRQGSSPGDIERTNAMYRNNGDGTYTEVGADIGLADNAQSWATVFEDFDNDGDFDAFIVNHTEQNRFMVNDGAGNYTESIMTSGIAPDDLGAWENASGDFNNDGYIDIFSELSQEIYLNNGDMTFTGYDLPFDDGGIGDLNNDGFLDVIKGNTVWLNETNDNHWVKINTLGIESNKNGIGARVEIYGSWGVQIREVRAGESFSPMSSLAIHFGIGTATEIDSITVKWPSGILTNLVDPEINTTYNIPETNCMLAISSLEVNGSTELCAGQSVEITAPTGFNSYAWSNGATTQSITVSDAGGYNVALTNGNDCISLSNTVDVTIVSEEIPVVNLEGADEFCVGGSVVLSTDIEGSPVWSNNESGQSITVTESGLYYVEVESVCSGLMLTSEVVEVNVVTPETPVVEDAVILQPGPATITATGDNLEWYDSPTLGNQIGTGNDFDFTFIDADSTIYVESHLTYGGDIQNGAKPDDSGNGGLPSTGAYNYFDVYEPFTLLSVEVYVPNNAPNGVRTIQLVDTDSVTVLEEITIDLDNGQQHTVNLNFALTEGTDYSLRCLENDLFRNNAGVSYPYPIGDVGSITTSFYGNQYYYYFYNWKIEKQTFECVSDRVEAHASIFVSTNEIPGTLAGLNIYPNPAHDKVSIEFDALKNLDLNIQLFDLTGREVQSETMTSVNTGSQQTSLDLTDLPKSVYTIQLSTDGQRVNQKLVVQ